MLEIQHKISCYKFRVSTGGIETRWPEWQFLNNNAGRLGAGFISVCLETRWLCHLGGFYVPECYCTHRLHIHLFSTHTDRHTYIHLCLKAPQISYPYTYINMNCIIIHINTHTHTHAFIHHVQEWWPNCASRRARPRKSSVSNSKPSVCTSCRIACRLKLIRPSPTLPNWLR